MQMAIIVFDGMTTLDFAGFHNAVTWLKRLELLNELTWHFCSDKAEVTDDRGMVMKTDRVLPDLGEYDLVFIPGGMATRQLIHDSGFVEWIRTAEQTKYKASVCTGAILLGAAGFTKDKTITTNPHALELAKPYCKEVVRARAMRDGDLFTGGGIAASIDLGLLFVGAVAGDEAVARIQSMMDYPYYGLEAR